MVDAHGVVGGDRAVDEGPLGLTLAQGDHLLEGALLLPELEHLPLLGGEIDFVGDFGKWHVGLRCGFKP